MEQWWKSSVVYQIYPRSFQDSNGDGVGDINGIIARLDYLQELGVDVLWLSPVYQSGGQDNGYDIADYQAIETAFGTMQDFDRLLQQAHLRGLKVVMDLVVNHTSDQHAWFVESRASRENPKRDYYIWREGTRQTPPNNWGASFGGSAWQWDDATNMYYLHMFAPGQPDLNWENPELRQSVYSMMRWWCDKGIDGFRMDVINMISKDPALPDGPVKDGLYGDGAPYVNNGPHVHDYLREMRREVLDRYDLITVGETPCVTPEDAARYASLDGSELNMVFQFEHVDLDGGELGKWTTKRVPMPLLRENISKWQTALEGRAWNSLYWNNHDQPRAVSRFGDDRPEYRELSAKLLATCLHMLKGTPYIYQGEELGMTNAPFARLAEYRDVESLGHYEQYTKAGLATHDHMMDCLRAKSRDNARTPMQWSGDANAGFTTGTPWIAVNPNHATINAESQLQNTGSVFRYYQALIRLRHENPVIVHGAYRLLLEDSPDIWAYTRTLGEERLLVLLNFSDRTVACDKADGGEAILISNYSSHTPGALQPYEAVVYKGKALE